MGAFQSAYHNIVPAGINERNELYWTNERNEISRDKDLPAIIKLGKYKMWYQNGILDRPSGGPVFESYRERIYFKNGVPHNNSEDVPAIRIDRVTPIFQCCRDSRCDCSILDYENSKKCKLVGFYKPILYSHSIPDLSKYCSQFDNNTIYAHAFYKNGKLHSKRDITFNWQYRYRGGLVYLEQSYIDGNLKKAKYTFN